ncbi:MAG: hypothetical protein K5752_05470 [Succinivibrionaceae bacterium]|nr:hypothetical protein [Succinivibrionaceae bacterium]
MYHSYRSYHAFGDYRDLFFIIPAVAVLVFILVGIFKRDLKSTSENKRKEGSRFLCKITSLIILCSSGVFFNSIWNDEKVIERFNVIVLFALFGYVHFVLTVLLIKIMTFFRYSFFKVLVYGILSACVLNLFLLPAFCTDRASAADFIAPCIFILAGTAFLVFRMDRERVKDESEELRRSLEDQRNRFR